MFIDILLKPVNKIPLGMIYNVLIYSKIRTIDPVFNEKHFGDETACPDQSHRRQPSKCINIVF